MVVITASTTAAATAGTAGSVPVATTRSEGDNNTTTTASTRTTTTTTTATTSLLRNRIHLHAFVALCVATMASSSTTTTTTTTTIASSSSTSPSPSKPTTIIMKNSNNNYQKATLTLIESTSWSYRAEIATHFGYDETSSSVSSSGLGGGGDNNGDGLGVGSEKTQPPPSTPLPSRVMMANLMTPPLNYSSLCEFPQELLDGYLIVSSSDANSSGEGDGSDTAGTTTTVPDGPFDDESLIIGTTTETGNAFNHSVLQQEPPTEQQSLSSLVEFPYPVALLVGLGGSGSRSGGGDGSDNDDYVDNNCDPWQKARVALAIQRRITNNLKYIIFYHNDGANPDVIPRLSSWSSSSSPPHNNENLNSEIDSTATASPTTTTMFQPSIVFATVSTGTGTAILSKMERLAKMTNTRPELLNDEYNNDQWMLRMVLEQVVVSSQNGGEDGGTNTNDDETVNDDPDSFYQGKNDGSDSVYWLRFVLFALLIVSPCLRAAFLWWAGGGRIYWRRDDVTGRIVGLQYIPPMANWIRNPLQTTGHDDDERNTNRLTEEEVYALPEIGYEIKSMEQLRIVAEKSPRDDSLQRDDEKQRHLISTSQPKEMTSCDTKLGLAASQNETAAVNLIVRSGRTDSDGEVLVLPTSDEIVQKDDGTAAHDENDDTPITFPVESAEIEIMDEEQPLDDNTASSVESQYSPPSHAFSSTTCTTCSICIEEFKMGEKLRLLPRCGHAFHTECILPWLTERQGCCPLCKTNVLCSEEERTADVELDDTGGSQGSATGVPGGGYETEGSTATEVGEPTEASNDTGR